VLSQRPRVLVVEDDPPIRLAVEVALRGEDYEVRAESDGTRLEQLNATFRPDLAVLDVRLPIGPDGFSMASQLRRSGSIPLLFLSAADSVDDRLAGFDAGADDYLVKPFSMAELLARVQALLRRSDRLISSSHQVGDLVVDHETRVVVRAGRPLEMTRTEYELLTMLMLHTGKVLSKTQLLTQVWGFDAYDPNLVEVHMSALRRKLEAAGPRLIHTVRGAGYVMRA
jgi:two-component system, OmpR family, response regulator